MRLYRINITPCDSAGEGEDWDEWFGSLVAAKKRRRELLKDPDYSYCGCNYSVDRVVIPNLPKKKLLLKVLNREHLSSTEIVPESNRPT